MRRAVVVAFLAACGHHSGVSDLDANGSNVAPPDACTELGCFVVDCASKGLPPTTLTGTVYAPNGTLPLYGVDVYVPRTPPGPLAEGVQCSNCADGFPGGSYTQTRTDETGHFEIKDVPATANVPLVIQVGKWRRQITIPNVAACQSLPLAEADTRLPKNKTEGDLPKIAMSTGGADAIECLLYKLGIDPAEFTPATGTGRVHMFSNFSINPAGSAGGAGRGTDQFNATYPGSPGAMFSSSEALWGTEAALSPYDIVLLSCEGSQNKTTKPLTALQAMKAYADKGGRVFMSHWHNIWIGGTSGSGHYGLAEWEAVATWDFNAAQDEANQLAIIDQTVPKGMSFAKWLQNTEPGSTLGQLTVNQPRYTCSNRDATKGERWVYVDPALSTPAGKVSIQDLLFTTPQTKPEAERCGKVLFSDMHVSNGSVSQGGTGQAFPNGCSTTPLSAQEKALAFIFFDISSCVGTIF
jgi:hypothetical protein